jgi:DNA-binding response OmpR family regulator
MGESHPAVLIADDDAEMRCLLWDALFQEGYELRVAGDGNEAATALLECRPTLILTDLHLPSGGMTYITRLRILAPTVPILVMTGFGHDQERRDVLRAGATLYLNKPLRMFVLKAHIKEQLAQAVTVRSLPLL